MRDEGNDEQNPIASEAPAGRTRAARDVEGSATSRLNVYDSRKVRSNETTWCKNLQICSGPKHTPTYKMPDVVISWKMLSANQRLIAWCGRSCLQNFTYATLITSETDILNTKIITSQLKQGERKDGSAWMDLKPTRRKVVHQHSTAAVAGVLVENLMKNKSCNSNKNMRMRPKYAAMQIADLKQQLICSCLLTKKQYTIAVAHFSK